MKRLLIYLFLVTLVIGCSKEENPPPGGLLVKTLESGWTVPMDQLFLSQLPPGAHDDGAGCVMSADVLRIFKEMGLKIKRIIRVVLFMDEELYQSGGDAYAESVKAKGEKHLFALESDGGAFTPRYFTVSATPEVVAALAKFQPLLHPYGIEEIKAGWGGVDIGPLKDQGIPLVGYGTDSQCYFDMHHSPNDSFDKINLRELQLGCGNMAAFIYLIDKYGIVEPIEK